MLRISRICNSSNRKETLEMADSSAWPAAPADWQLESTYVDIWRSRLDLPVGRIARCRKLLSADEMAAAEQFRIATKQREYVVARGLLRELLGRALSVDPRSLTLGYGPHGKPYLTDALAGADVAVSFNVSHSHELLLIAVTAGRAVGIDVERIRADVECEKLARRFFSTREAQSMIGLPVDERCRAFFRCWTRKEALVKAGGSGIWSGLDRFDVSLRPDEPPALLATRPDAQEALRWSLVELDVGDGYAAALAIEGRECSARCWNMR
jgi:4'-phosphopantetheinyl transferase